MRETLDATELDLIERALESAFTFNAQHKGLYYQENGRVEQVAVAADRQDGAITICGTVHGGGPQPYQVEARVSTATGEPTIESKCSCPARTNCKHVAAVLLEAGDNLSDEEPSEPVEQPEPSPQLSLLPDPAETSPLPPGLQDWLRKLEDAAQPGTPTDDDTHYPPGITQRVVYLLRLKNGALTVELQIAGSHSYSYQVTPDWILTQANQGIRPIDRVLAAKLKADSPERYDTVLRLRGRPGAELLASMLATGRCFFRSSDRNQAPLRRGEPRPAKPFWKMDRQGKQRPSFEISPPAAHVLSLAPLYYLDERDGSCGPLETGLADGLSAAWMQAPVIAPAHANEIGKILAQQVAHLGAPPPQSIPVTEVTHVTPVPCLRLFSVDVEPSYGGYHFGKNDSATLAHLTFDYQGWIVPSNKLPITEEFRDAAVRRLHRMPGQEHQAEAHLHRRGFTSAETYFYGLPAGCRHAQTLPDAEHWFDFVHREVPKLREAGWRIEVDESFQFRIAEPESWYADADELAGSNDWFGVELGVVVDGQKVNLLPILIQHFQANPKALSAEALAALGDDGILPVTLSDGRTLAFPAKRLRGTLGVLLDLLDADALTKQRKLKLGKLRAAELSGLAAEADWRWLGGAELAALNQRLRKFEGIKPVAPSVNLQTALRPYQQEGLNWLQFLREYELGGVLADDMGLGKTVQTLAHLLAEKESGRADRPSLVVAPTSLMTNWRQETERFAPSLRVLVLHGLGRKQNFDRVNDHDLIITSYPLLPRDQEFLLGQQFHCVILDEAQYIKNPKTIYAQVACQLQARHHLCLTGTPMENHLGELWSLFNFLLPGFLGLEPRFNAVFRRPIEKAKCEDRRKLLARRVAPFLLRRRKEEVVKELPPKTEIVQNVELEGGQRDLYESIRLAMHQRVKEEVDKKGINRAHIIILDALLKLRQVCCDPRLVKLPSARPVKESAKLELLMELLPGMIEEGRRILLFSQFTSMLALIEQALRSRSINYVLLTGETRDRATPIQQFQKRQVPLFLISLKAGGTGLNLTAADTVIHYDPWWNPAVENQATDRAHRIGQDKPVFVYKLMTVGTVEEKIGALQARKRELVEGLLNEERRESVHLSAEDLDVLFAPLA